MARLIDHSPTANHIVHQVPANGVPAECPTAVTVGVYVMHVKIGKGVFEPVTAAGNVMVNSCCSSFITGKISVGRTHDAVIN